MAKLTKAQEEMAKAIQQSSKNADKRKRPSETEVHPVGPSKRGRKAK